MCAWTGTRRCSHRTGRQPEVESCCRCFDRRISRPWLARGARRGFRLSLTVRLRAASVGVERSLNGVLQELSSVLFGSLLPPDRDYHLEAQGDHFRITFGSDEVRIDETMNEDHG